MAASLSSGWVKTQWALSVCGDVVEPIGTFAYCKCVSGLPHPLHILVPTILKGHFYRVDSAEFLPCCTRRKWRASLTRRNSVSLSSSSARFAVKPSPWPATCLARRVFAAFDRQTWTYVHTEMRSNNFNLWSHWLLHVHLSACQQPAIAEGLSRTMPRHLGTGPNLALGLEIILQQVSLYS